jgi:hypothetical protein
MSTTSTQNDYSRKDASASRDPVVVDLGAKKKKLLKELRQGKGKLVADVKQCIDELVASGVVSGTIQPVVVVVSERLKNRCILCRLIR